MDRMRENLAQILMSGTFTGQAGTSRTQVSFPDGSTFQFNLAPPHEPSSSSAPSLAYTLCDGVKTFKVLPPGRVFFEFKDGSSAELNMGDAMRPSRDSPSEN